MSTWRIGRGQLSGLGNALAASLPQQLVAYFRLVPRVLVSRAGVAGAAGSNPAATFFSCLPCVARRRLWKESVLTPEWAQPRRRSRPGDEGKPSGFSLISLWPTSVWCPGCGCLGAWARVQGGSEVGEDVRDLAAHLAQDDEHDHEDQDQDQRERADREADRESDPAASRTRCGAPGCRHPRLAVPPPKAVLRIGGSPAGAVPPPVTVRWEGAPLFFLSPGRGPRGGAGRGGWTRRGFRGGGVVQGGETTHSQQRRSRSRG